MDFVVPEEELIQVSYDVNDPETLERELKGLKKAANTFGYKKITLITWDTEEERNIGNVKVKLTPLWKWMLRIED